MKRCRDCGDSKPLTHFHKNNSYKDGLTRNCKSCRSDDYYRLTHSTCKDCGKDVYKKNKDLPCPFCSKPKKVCDKCGELKLLSKFHLNRGAKDGRQSNCIVCRVRRKQKVKVKDPYCEAGHCVFYDTCDARIKDRTFGPYCFVSSKYHGLYQQEYDRRETAGVAT